MKRVLISLFACIGFMLSLVCCSNGSSSDSSRKSGGGDFSVTDIKQSNFLLSVTPLFGAKALAGVSHDSSGTYNLARAADTETSAVVKILEDGSISSVLSFPPQVTLSSVSDMIKSETPNGTFLYVIFNNPTHYNYKTTDGTWVYGFIGQILCVHEDGTFHDILGTEGNEQPVQLLYSRSKMQFDGTGNMYYMAINGASSGSVLYRYNPFTGTKTALTAAISGVSVTAFQISKDGNWIFTRGNSNSDQFLRATPLADTENPQDIVYGNDKSIDSWVYDDTTDSVYVASGVNLYKYIKDTTTGKFSTESYKTLVGSSESITEIENKRNEFWKKCDAFRKDVNDNLFDSHSEMAYTADWKGFLSYYDYNESKTQDIIILNDDGSLNAENLLKGLLVKSWNSLSESRRYETVTDENGREHQKAVYLTTDDVDLRFDLFADIEGFEALAEATAGKKNAEALAALDSKEKRGLLCALLLGNGSQSRYAYDDKWRCFYHNFFADVLYVKDTDILLVDSDDSAFSKSNVKTTAFQNRGLDSSEILSNTQGKGMTVYTLGAMYQKENGTADTQKILEFFFSYCNEKGTKEFRLTAFKDDEEYSDLYAEGLVDDEAIAYITAKERIDLFRRCIASSRSAVTEDYKDYKDYKDYQNLIFLHDTCFLKETGTSACTLKLIDYDTSRLFRFSDLVWNNSELWGKGSNWNPETQKNSLQLMKILDSNHEFSGAIISLDVTFNWYDRSNNNIQITDGYVYYRNNISGSTSDIRRISLADGNAEENLFTNVNGNWEVLSFIVSGDYLYYSSYRGTAINNGRITLSTKENTPLSDTFKLTALTAY